MKTGIINKILVLGLSLSALMLSGCGGSGGTVASNEINVTASLGLITDATVIFYQSDGTTKLGESTTGASGIINIAYSGSYDGPVVVVVKGTSTAQYFDEATGTTVPFAAGALLRALVPAGTSETAVTMLTELAYQLSVANSIALTNTSVNQLNEKVRQALAPELMSILTPPVLFDANTTGGSLDNTEAGRYALRLAALAQLGASDATPALKVTEQLAADLADGVIDGQSNGTPVAGLLYSSATFVSDLAGHVTTVSTNFGDTGLQSAISGYAPVSTNIDVSDVTTGGGTGLPAGVAGQVVTMEYCCAGSGSPYSNGDQVLFTFSSSGALMLTDQNTLIADSFTVRGSEYVWNDTANGIEYALSVLNGAINEVNVQGSGGSPFYGQFAPVTTGGGGTTLTLTGDGAALSGGNGATGTVDTTTYTYTTHPTGGDLYVVAPLDNTGLFDAYESAITKWSVHGFPATAGSYSCGGGGNLPTVSLTINGTPYLADTCTIEVLSASLTDVEGRFAAVLKDASGNVFGTVTDGYFRYSPAASGGSGLAAGELGYSMDVDGVNVTVTGVPALDEFDRQVAGYITLGDTPTLQIRMIPDAASGTFVCGQGPNSFRLVAMTYNGYVSDNSFNGSCSADITFTNNIFEGTFSAILYATGGEMITITNGFFRNDATALAN